MLFLFRSMFTRCQIITTVVGLVDLDSVTAAATVHATGVFGKDFHF